MTYLDFIDYQEEAKRTMDNPDSHGVDLLAIFALGVAGEAGEVADLVKKHLGYGKDMHDGDKLAKEIGDVLWYLAAVCEVSGLTLAKCAHMNIIKLRERFPNGFNHKDASARVDVKP